jgi:hypothetical protein
MFPRTLRRLLVFAPAVSVALAPGSAGHAFETNPLKVYGEDRPALQAGIRYWNGLAGKELLHYAGERPDESSASTVIVKTGDLEAHQLAGRASGLVGATPISVTVGFFYVGDWVVYAHELGHALGFGDYDTDGETSRYDGVMSYISMWDDPSAEADRALVDEHCR